MKDRNIAAPPAFLQPHKGGLQEAPDEPRSLAIPPRRPWTEIPGFGSAPFNMKDCLDVQTVCLTRKQNLRQATHRKGAVTETQSRQNQRVMDLRKALGIAGPHRILGISWERMGSETEFHITKL
jgi:hypothetical protein